MKAIPIHWVELSFSLKINEEAINTMMKPVLVNTGYASDNLSPCPRTYLYAISAIPKEARPDMKIGLNNVKINP